MTEPQLYNSRIIRTFLEYLAKYRPEIDREKLISASGISSYEIEDEGHWLTQAQVDSFNDALMAQSNDPLLPREAGRYMATANSLNTVRQFMLGFITPMQAYLRMPRTAAYLNRATRFIARKIAPNKVEIAVEIFEGVTEKPYQCENRLGTFEAVAQLFTGKLPQIEHIACIHKGDKRCVYVVSWDEPTYFRLRRIRNYLSVLLIPGLAVCGFSLPPLRFAGLFVATFTVLAGISYYALFDEKRKLYEKIEQRGDTANRLLDQIATSYENSLLVQEIGRAVSNTLDIDRLSEVLSDTFKKRLNFDRGMIMLATPDRTRLVYTAGYGYDPELEPILKNAVFHLDNPDSRGPFVSSFTRQEPILVDNINDIKHDLSPHSREFAAKLGTTSFICVPIVFEGISEGVLSVDNYKSSRPLGQTGINMLLGIAAQIAISLNNAKNFVNLQRSEKRFRTLSENAPDIIYTLDKNGLVTYVNPAINDHLGYLPEELIGKKFSLLVDKEDTNLIDTLFNEIRNGRKTLRNVRARFVSRDGNIHLFAISGAPNEGNSEEAESTGIIGVLRDVTEQVRLEEQLRHTSKMKAIGQLTGGIAHDFNNILQAISSYAELARLKGQGKEVSDKYVSGIQELTDRGKTLVKQLMMFGRKEERNLHPLDLNSEIEGLTKLLKETFPRDIEISLKLQDGLKFVNGDPGEIQQVILNLAVNARDAMPDGGLLTIETRNVFIEKSQACCMTIIRPGHYVFMRVSDTGSGMDKKTLDHIFEPFFTTKGVGRGTGIGLAVVYGVTKNHGGYITCTSEPGRGTKFELYFPSVDASSDKSGDDGEFTDSEVNDKNVEGKTLLLVDDEMALRETGVDMLSLWGYSVLAAASGEEALDVLKKEGDRVDIVIMDIMMPGMGGVACLGEIMKIYPQKKVIMASGYVADVKKKTIMDAGAAAFIQKPYKFDELKRIIREVMVSSPGT